MAEKDFVVKNGLIVNTSLIFANGDLARVGINNTSPDASLSVTGTANVSGNVTLGSNLTVVGTATPGRILVGNTTVNLTQNSSLLQVANSTGTSNLTAVDLKIGSATVNTSTVTVGNVIVNSTAVFVGNSTDNLVANGILITLANTTSSVNVTPSSIRIGNTVTNVSINSSSFSGTSNNSTNFAGQPQSYYANAENITSGTLSNARLSSAVVNTSGNFTLSGNTTLAGTNTNITSNATISGLLSTTKNVSLVSSLLLINSSAGGNTISTGVANVNFDSGVLFVDAINNRVGIKNTSPDAELTITGSANVSGNLTVLGDFIISGNTVSSGTTEYTGALTPQANGLNLGNTSNRWDLYSRNIDLTGNIVFNGANLQINTSAAIVWTGNTTTSPTIVIANTGLISIGSSTTTQTTANITLANSSANAQITPNFISVANSTGRANVTPSGFAGNGASLTSLNATELTSGTIPYARIPVNIVNTTGTFTLSGNTQLGGTTTTVTSNLTVSGSTLSVAGAFTANSTGAYHTGTVNAASHTVGANIAANTTGITFVGNTTTSPTVSLANTGAFNIGNSSTTQTTSIISIANSAGSSNVTPAGFFGNAASLTSLNATELTSGTIPYARIPANIVNTTANFTISGNTVFSANVTLNRLIVNGSIGSAGQALYSGGTANAYWAAVVTSVASGNGLSGGPITTTGTVSVLANTGIVANSTGLFVNATYIGTLTANNTSFVGSVSAANVVSNAQLSANLANYQTTAGLSANVATLTANNSTNLNGKTEGNLNVNNALTANNSTNLNGQAASFYTNASNITTGILPSARLSGSYTSIGQVGTLTGLRTSGSLGVNTTSPSVTLDVSSNDAIFIPRGTTAERPTGANGMLRFNTDTSMFEGYSNNAWGNVVSSSSGGYYKGNNGAIGETASRNNLYRINSNTQSNNITINSGENALTVGPLVIQSGYNLTIDAGGRAVII